MSDDETGVKKSGYRLEYASSARAKCKGPKPCSGTAIQKGELRFGSVVDFKGNTSFAWRHWGCVTPKIISNMQAAFESPDDLDGFEDLNDADKEKIRRAWQDGKVAEEDIPPSAHKPQNDEEGEDKEEEKPKKKGGRVSKKADDEDKKGVFKLEYASSGRAKCKDGCGEGIGKDYFRLGHEIDFRGNKSFTFTHWGCTPDKLIAKLKKSYDEPSAIEGFSDLKEAEQEKVKAAWEEGSIPEDDKGPGEPVETEKKKPVKRAKKDADGEPPKKRARKAKKIETEDEGEEEEEEEEEEKPKKRAPTKKAAEKEKAPAKKRAPKKKREDNESDEDLADELAAADKDDEEDDEGAEEEASTKKRKRAPASKATKVTSSKPPSKAASSKPATKTATTKPASKSSSKPASKAASTKPASKRATKPASSRAKKPQPETINESEEEDE